VDFLCFLFSKTVDHVSDAEEEEVEESSEEEKEEDASYVPDKSLSFGFVFGIFFGILFGRLSGVDFTEVGSDFTS